MFPAAQGFRVSGLAFPLTLNVLPLSAVVSFVDTWRSGDLVICEYTIPASTQQARINHRADPP
jgi:hypothetical protein